MNLDRLGGGTFDFTVKTRKHQMDVWMMYSDISSLQWLQERNVSVLRSR